MVPAPRTFALFPRLTMIGGVAAVLLVGAWLRLSGINWDERQHLHPDERFLTMVVTAERWPQNVGEYFDESRSLLNPRNVGFSSFAYGTLPTTLVKGLSLVMGRPGYDEVPLVGRLASAVADLATVIFIVLLARRLYGDERIALLAGAFHALAVLPIQHAHFFVVDPFATCFVTGALWMLSRARAGLFLPMVGSGVFFGLALACKISVAPLAVVILAVAWQRQGRQHIGRAGGPIVAAAMVTLVTFRLAQPDAFNGPGLFGVALSSRWLANLWETRQLMSGAIDFPPGVQWAGRPAVLFSLDNLVRWNLGPLLGLTVCAAVTVAAWQLATRRERPHLVPVLWTALVFVPQATQFVKAGRYLLPIYPALTTLAAWLLVRAWDRADNGHESAWRRVCAGTVIAAVCVSTAVWAFAFTSIYRRANTRVAASRWIYSHVPAGVGIATEYWDDALPLRLGGDLPDRYAGIIVRPYDDDTPPKLTTLVTELDAATYVVLSSNRLYDSIPRLPMRYPMTTRYYAALFSGALGFERVAEFTSYPALGGFSRPDQSAEEAFSVYDHARVQIFRKTNRWSAGEARRLLGDGVDWKGVVRLPPVRAAGFRNGLLFTRERFADVQRAGTWSRIFDPEDLANRFPVLLWGFVVELLGLVAFPLTSIVCRRLPDRGWLLSKTVGVLVVSYAAWLAASLRWLTFSRSTLTLALVTVGGAAAWHLWQHRTDYATFWQRRRALMMGEEALFWGAFALLLLIRSGHPDLWHPAFGGEKPMNFAYLNAVVRSETFPAYNPWFSGGYINYYYFGFVLVAAIVKLTGIVPEVAFNLAGPTFHALAIGGVFTVGFALVSALHRLHGAAHDRWPWLGGLLAVMCVTMMGNLVELRLLGRWLIDRGTSAWPVWWWYWNATRVIPHAPAEAPPITEFPFFTFLYGDLHAHSLALPLALVALAIALTFVLPSSEPAADTSDRGVGGTSLALLALVLGALYATNAWDVPTYALIAGGALALGEWRSHAPGAVTFATVRRVLVVVVLSRVLFAPFIQHYSQGYSRIALWSGSRTTLSAYLWIHGAFLFVLVTTLAAWLVHERRVRVPRPWTAPMGFLVLVATTGFVLSLAVEFIVMAGDISRMNTVFKFYFQVWVLWGLAAAVAATLAIAAWHGQPASQRTGLSKSLMTAWIGISAALLVACAIYPVLATRARWRDRFDGVTGFTLDGQAYMKTARHVEAGQAFALAPDLDAIHWLQRHVEGTPVIVEAHTSEYRWGARISTNTGLPTILGWRWHQTQQRGALPAGAVDRRAADIAAIYREADADSARRLLDEYQAGYIYVGALERLIYPAEGLAKFATRSDYWQRVYANAEVSIYRVRRDTSR